VCDLDAAVEEERAAANEQSVGPLARHSREDSIDFGDGLGVENADLYCHGARSRFDVPQIGRNFAESVSTRKKASARMPRMMQRDAVLAAMPELLQ
jgi:hypothetical protein